MCFTSGGQVRGECDMSTALNPNFEKKQKRKPAVIKRCNEYDDRLLL